MRTIAAIFLVACGTSHTSPVGGDDSSAAGCPANAASANGTACNDTNLQCTYTETSGRNLYCTCQSGHLWCSDCDANEYGFGSCTAGEGCSYSSWETDCTCTCTVRGNWNCTSDDAVSPCPRDPDPIDAGA